MLIQVNSKESKFIDNINMYDFNIIDETNPGMDILIYKIVVS